MPGPTFAVQAKCSETGTDGTVYYFYDNVPYLETCEIGPNWTGPNAQGLCYVYPTDYVDPDKKITNLSCDGNPINPATGVKYQMDVDYEGVGPFPLQHERVYRSDAPTSTLPSSTGASVANVSGGYRYKKGLYGQWYFAVMGEVVANLVPNSDNTRIRLPRRDGRWFTFTLVNGQWTGEADVLGRLTEQKDAGGATIGWQYKDLETDQTELYSAQMRLLSITNRSGLVQSYQYDSSGNVQSITDSFGRSLQYTYTASGQIQTLTDPAGQVYSYNYTPGGRVQSVTYPDTKVRQYVYENALFPNALTGITDENGTRFATWSYDTIGRAVSSEHAGGVERVELNYLSATNINITDYKDSPTIANSTRSKSFERVLGVAKISTVSQPCNGSNITGTTYDANGNVASRTDFNGNRTNYIYDLARNLETQRVEGLSSAGASTAQTRTISTEWHPTWRLPKRIAEPKRLTSFVYNGDAGVTCGATAALCSKTLTETTDANGASGLGATPTTNTRSWSYTYNSAGQVLTVNGPRTDASDVTTYAYYTANDPSGNFRIGDLASITNALGHITQITHYDAHGKPKRIVDPNGLVTQLDYWPRGWLKSRDVGGLITLFDYDGVGQLKKVTNPDGSFVSYTYDAAHRLTDITDTSGNTLHYTLDLMSNVTKEELKNSLGVVIATKNRQFDALSRLQKELNAANTELANYSYDANGNVKTATQKTTANLADDEITGYDYDPLNRLKKLTDALAGVAEYGYSGLDQLTLVKDPRLLSTTYTVDGLDNLTTQVSPDTGTTINTYDAAGNLKSMKDANNTTVTYTYDALNRLTQKAVGTTVINHTYDSVVSGNFGKGRLTGMTDASGTTAYTYDLYGRVTKKVHTPASGLGSNARTVQYGYDNFGRLGSITYPSGRVVNYAYTNGRVSALTVGTTQTVVNNIAYFGFNTPASWTQGSGKLYSRSFDADGRISSYTNNTSQIAVTYDLADNIKLLTDPGASANTKSFTHDKLNRLTGYGTNSGATSQGFAYDALGNRQSNTINGTATIYTSATTSNRLSSVGTNTYGYNAAGNQTTATSRTYAYDVFGRMSSATVSGVATPYRYNGLGQRLYKGGANLARMVYDEQGQLIGEYDNTGTMLREIVWLQDIPVAVMTPNSTATNLFYIDSDHLNTPRTITNQAKQKRWEWNSDPFGSTLANENPAALGVFTFNLTLPGPVLR